MTGFIYTETVKAGLLFHGNGIHTYTHTHTHCAELRHCRPVFKRLS